MGALGMCSSLIVRSRASRRAESARATRARAREDGSALRERARRERACSREGRAARLRAGESEKNSSQSGQLAKWVASFFLAPIAAPRCSRLPPPQLPSVSIPSRTPSILRAAHLRTRAYPFCGRSSAATAAVLCAPPVAPVTRAEFTSSVSPVPRFRLTRHFFNAPPYSLNSRAPLADAPTARRCPPRRSRGTACFLLGIRFWVHA